MPGSTGRVWPEEHLEPGFEIVEEKSIEVN
jgi:hypothetical protein